MLGVALRLQNADTGNLDVGRIGARLGSPPPRQLRRAGPRPTSRFPPLTLDDRRSGAGARPPPSPLLQSPRGHNAEGTSPNCSIMSANSSAGSKTLRIGVAAPTLIPGQDRRRPGRFHYRAGTDLAGRSSPEPPIRRGVRRAFRASQARPSRPGVCDCLHCARRLSPPSRWLRSWLQCQE